MFWITSCFVFEDEAFGKHAAYSARVFSAHICLLFKQSEKNTQYAQCRHQDDDDYKVTAKSLCKGNRLGQHLPPLMNFMLLMRKLRKGSRQQKRIYLMGPFRSKGHKKANNCEQICWLWILRWDHHLESKRCLRQQYR